MVSLILTLHTFHCKFETCIVRPVLPYERILRPPKTNITAMNNRTELNWVESSRIELDWKWEITKISYRWTQVCAQGVFAWYIHEWRRRLVPIIGAKANWLPYPTYRCIWVGLLIPCCRTQAATRLSIRAYIHDMMLLLLLWCCGCDAAVVDHINATVAILLMLIWTK